MAAARGLRDGAPVCRRHSKIAVGRALRRAAVGGRPARARSAGTGGRRRAAGAGRGRRRCSAETRSPSPRPRVPASPRPRVAASGLGHRASTGTWAGVGSARGPGPTQSWVSAGTGGLTGTGWIWGASGWAGWWWWGLLVSEVEPGPCASAQDRVGRVACTARVWGHSASTTIWGKPCTHHHLGASPIASLVGPGPGVRGPCHGVGRIPILQRPGVPRQHGVPSNSEVARLGDSNLCGAGQSPGHYDSTLRRVHTDAF